MSGTLAGLLIDGSPVHALRGSVSVGYESGFRKVNLSLIADDLVERECTEEDYQRYAGLKEREISREAISRRRKVS